MRLAMAVAFLALVACGDSITGPDAPDVAVSMVLLSSDVDHQVRVTFENLDEVAMLVSCGSFGVERLEGTTWKPASGPNCIPGSVEVPPGQSHAVTFSAPAGGHQFRAAVRFRSTADQEEQWVAYSETASW